MVEELLVITSSESVTIGAGLAIVYKKILYGNQLNGTYLLYLD